MVNWRSRFRFAVAKEPLYCDIRGPSKQTANESNQRHCFMSTAEQSVDKSDARVREMFGQIAGRYDFLNHLLSLNIDRYWRWRTVRAVPPRMGGRVLDLCTGTGDLAIAYHHASWGSAYVMG